MATAIIQQQITVVDKGREGVRYLVIPSFVQKTLDGVNVWTGPQSTHSHTYSLQYPDKTHNGQRETMQI